VGKPSWHLDDGEAIVPGRIALRRLGGGRRYEVYGAWDDRLDAEVVVKMLRPDQAEDATARRHLEREAAILRRLSHPGLVRMFDAVPTGPRPHLVLEHLEGPTLRRHVKTFGPLPMHHLVPLAGRLASVLHYLAGEDVVHLDVKPGNVIMSPRPTLIDLSLARPLDVAARLKKPVGTRAYMAPEQCDPVRLGPVGPDADVWGLGATLFFAGTGHKPFAPDDEGSGKHRDYPQLRRDHRTWPEDVPPGIVQVVDACLGREPRARPSPQDIAVALRSSGDYAGRHLRRARNL
jgi:eukaryotic-like serine/threonine-protein kinase